MAGETHESYAANRWLWAACVVFGVWNVWAILAGRCLFADGAHEFIRTLEARNFYCLQWNRHFAYDIPELPLVAAIHFGVVDLRWLRLAFGVGCALPWCLTLLICWKLSPKHVWIVVTACAAGYLNAAYMAIGEHIYAHALFWPAIFTILFARPLRAWTAAVLLVSCTGLLYSYESQLFFGLAITGLCLWRLHDERKNASHQMHWVGLVLFTAAALGLAAAIIGLSAILVPANPGEFGGFGRQCLDLLFNQGTPFTWTLLWIVLMLAAWGSQRLGALLTHKLAIVPTLACVALWGLWPLLAPAQLDPAKQFHLRILDLIVPLGLLPVALVCRYRPAWIDSSISRLQILAAILLTAQSLWHFSATCRWQQDLAQMQALLASNRGVIPFDATPLARSSLDSRRHDFVWSMPCLSIAANPDRHIQSLVCSEWYAGPQRKRLWQPFDPLDPNQLPHLQSYGIDYSNYVTALTQK